MTQAELIAALPAGRLPPELLGFNPTDLLALFGAGLIVSAFVLLLAGLLFTRRTSKRTLIRHTRVLPPEERLLAIARILGHMPEELRPAAYGSVALPPGETIERIALKSKTQSPSTLKRLTFLRSDDST